MNKTIFLLLFADVSNTVTVVLGADNAAPCGDGPSGCCNWPSCYDERVVLCSDIRQFNNIDFSSEISTVHKFVYTDEALLLVRQ